MTHSRDMRKALAAITTALLLGVISIALVLALRH